MDKRKQPQKKQQSAKVGRGVTGKAGRIVTAKPKQKSGELTDKQLDSAVGGVVYISNWD